MHYRLALNPPSLRLWVALTTGLPADGERLRGKRRLLLHSSLKSKEPTTSLNLCKY